jgi:hypothetical protein
MSAIPPTAAPPASRRTAVRRHAALGTVCRLDTGTAAPAPLGLVWNLSSSGVSMLLHEPLPVQSVFAAELQTVNEQHALPITLRVVHIRPIRTGDYFLGAQFNRPLEPQELSPFLAESTAVS